MISPTAWNLRELRSRVRESHSNPDQILELINSIERSIYIFRHHMETARDALKGIVNESEPQGLENIMFTLGLSEKQSEFDRAQIVSEANIIGCLYTARNLWDVFAQLVNTLVLIKPLTVSSCDISRVVPLMPPSSLKEKLEELLQSHWYTYVTAFINTTKHRQLVQHIMTLSENRAGIQIGSFT